MTEPADDPVDREVAQLYEDHPYPAHGVLSGVVAGMLRPPLSDLLTERGTARLQLVDLGCGTGEQTCGIGRAFPALDVLGVDRSSASISYARRFAAQHGLRNVRFECADILRDAGVLNRPDVVVSVGVLHHLADPASVLRTLSAAATPGALLFGMVYGRFGSATRLRTVEALAMIAGDQPRGAQLDVVADGVRSNVGLSHKLEMLGRRRRFGPSISARETLDRMRGGTSPSYQADYYTHPRAATYTWAEVAALLESGGWNFVGWPPRSGMPDRPDQVVKGKAEQIISALPLLDQAAVYERLVAPFALYFLGRS